MRVGDAIGLSVVDAGVAGVVGFGLVGGLPVVPVPATTPPLMHVHWA